MSGACPAMPGAAEASLAQALAAIDCRLDAAVAAGYGRLFGHAGMLAGALTAVLTIYVAVLALGLVGGRWRLTLAGAMPRVLALGLVLTFATAWPAYQVVVSDLVVHGPDQVASAFAAQGSGATRGFLQHVDEVFGHYLELAQALQPPQGQSAAPDLQAAAKLAWAGALLLVLSTAGLLVMARVVLAILLALGPLFIVFALFGATRGLFEGWLKTLVAFALAPLLIVLGGTGLLALVAPLLDEVLRDPLAAGEALRPVAVLFLASLVYAGTLGALLWTAASLTRGWRGTRAEPPVAVAGSANAPVPASQPPVSHTVAAAANAAATDAETRLAAVSVALARQSVSSAPARIDVRFGAAGGAATDGRRGGNGVPRWGRGLAAQDGAGAAGSMTK